MWLLSGSWLLGNQAEQVPARKGCKTENKQHPDSVATDTRRCQASHLAAGLLAFTDQQMQIWSLKCIRHDPTHSRSASYLLHPDKPPIGNEQRVKLENNYILGELLTKGKMLPRSQRLVSIWKSQYSAHTSKLDLIPGTSSTLAWPK